MLSSVLIALIRLYRCLIAPWFGTVCRFEPSCSRYTEVCIRQCGPTRGLWLGMRRVLRCHPWSVGGVDHPPAPHPTRRQWQRQKTILIVLVGACCAMQSHMSFADPTGQSSRARLRSATYDAEVVADRGGALNHFYLSEKQFRQKGSPHNVVTTTRPEFRPLQLVLSIDDTPVDTAAIRWTLSTPSQDTVVIEGGNDRLWVHRKLQPGSSPYTLWSTVVVQNTSSKPLNLRVGLRLFHYVRRAEEKGGFMGAPAHGLSHGLCGQVREGKKAVERLTRENIAEKKTLPNASTYLVALENLYFVSAAAADMPIGHGCQFAVDDRGGTLDAPDGTLFEGNLNFAPMQLAAGQTQTLRTLSYFGPKRHPTLRAAGHHLSDAVDLGFFSTIARSLVSLLSAIHSVVPNWGLAIIILTLLVKLLLYPLTEKSFQSMARMRNLKPELDRINELYGNDRQKKGAATMELYRKHGINPMGGCLPQLLQLPIWWALYTSLSTNVELYNAPFMGWLHDLSARDPYFILPVFLGGLMFIQQKLTPNTSMDPMQAKMMTVMMPVMMTAFMLFLPAGLCIYMVTNSVLGIAQQKAIELRLQKRSAP